MAAFCKMSIYFINLISALGINGYREGHKFFICTISLTHFVATQAIKRFKNFLDLEDKKVTRLTKNFNLNFAWKLKE